MTDAKEMSKEDRIMREVSRLTQLNDELGTAITVAQYAERAPLVAQIRENSLAISTLLASL